MAHSIGASARTHEVDQPCKVCGCSAPFRVRSLKDSRRDRDVDFYCRYHLPIDSALATSFDRFLQTDLDRALIRGFEEVLKKENRQAVAAA